MPLTFDAFRERHVLGLVCLDKWVRFSALHMTMLLRDLHTLTSGPDNLSQLCYLLKLAGVTMEFIMKKLFSVSLKDKASDWYKLLDNSDLLEWQELMSLFYEKIYPLREIHQDRNYIYNFWYRDGESITQAWGRLKSLVLRCPNHEIPKEIILTIFYARISCQDKEMLDASLSRVFQTRSTEEKWDLI